MLNFAICEIMGKQYKILPNQPLLISYQKLDDKNLEVDVLLISEDGKFRLGKPFLKEKIRLNILDYIKGKKIRVSKYHAKANFRRLKGFRPEYARVILDVKNP